MTFSENPVRSFGDHAQARFARTQRDQKARRAPSVAPESPLAVCPRSPRGRRQQTGQRRLKQGLQQSRWRFSRRVSFGLHPRKQGLQRLRRTVQNVVRSPHLLVNLDQEVIEALDAYQPEPGKFHVHDYVERERKSPCEPCCAPWPWPCRSRRAASRPSAGVLGPHGTWKCLSLVSGRRNALADARRDTLTR